MTINPKSEFLEIGTLWRAAAANDKKLGPPDNHEDRDMVVVNLEYNLDAEMGVAILVRKSKWDEKKKLGYRARLTLTMGILERLKHILICDLE